MPTEVLERHPELWFSDGSVILLAIKSPPPALVKRLTEDMSDTDSDDVLHLSDMEMDDEGGDESEVEFAQDEKLVKILFKVHKSILARSSQMFADMFALPELRGDIIPESVVAKVFVGDEETYDELPLITMTDSSKDVESLLMTIYDPLTLRLRRRKPDTPLLVEPLMTMLDKFQCDKLCLHINSHIARDWPRNLEEWIDVEKEDILAQEKTILLGGDIYWAPHILPEPAAALCFAVKYRGRELKNVLPAILYDLVRCSPLVMWDESMNLPTPRPQRKAAAWNRLRADDLLKIAKAKSHLARLFNASSFSTSKRCLTKEMDEQEVEKLRNYIRGEVADGDVLRVLTENIGFAKTDPLTNKFGICGSCLLRVHNQLVKARESVWKVMVKVANEYHI